MFEKLEPIENWLGRHPFVVIILYVLSPVLAISLSRLATGRSVAEGLPWALVFGISFAVFSLYCHGWPAKDETGTEQRK